MGRLAQTVAEMNALRRRLRDRLHARHKDRLTSRLLRLLYYRLIVPIKRSRDDPAPIARGVFMGLLIGMTPTVGIQMYLIFAVWLVAAKVFRWNFNLLLAIAWSWLSNPITMIPFYYVYYVTGKVILIDFDALQTFARFSEGIEATGAEPTTLFEQVIEHAALLWNEFGGSVLVGWIPYSLGMSVLGYVLAASLVRRSRKGG